MVHATRIFPTGRTFMRRLYDSLSGKRAGHRIRVNQSIRSDLFWWKNNLPAHTHISMSDVTAGLESASHTVFTDAAGARNCGAAGFWHGHWFFHPWSQQQYDQFHDNSTWLELFAVMLAINTWHHHWKNQVVIIFCDNEPAVADLKTLTSQLPHLMNLLRVIARRRILHSNVKILPLHISTEDNEIADSISRLQWNRLDKIKAQKPFSMLSNPDNSQYPL